MSGRDTNDAVDRWRLQVNWPASGEVVAYDLSKSLRPGIPHAPVHPGFSFTLLRKHGDVLYGPERLSAAAEMITTGGHVGTHVDALGHVARDGRVYGGEDVLASQSYVGGLGVGSVDDLPPLMGRGCMVDGPRLFGRMMEPGEAVGSEHLEEWFSPPRQEPGRGSIVLVRTGWMRHWDDAAAYAGARPDAPPPGVALPGVDISAARWLTDRGILATGADTLAYEVMPSASLEVHAHLLVDHGVPIMEMVNLETVAEAGVYEFFFIAIPLPIKGGTGSPIRPLAIVPAAGGRAPG